MIKTTDALGGKGYYDDSTGNGNRTLSFTIDLSAFDAYKQLSKDDLLLVLKNTFSATGVNNSTYGNVGVNSYRIDNYNATTGKLTISVNYASSYSRISYTFEIYALM